MSFVRFANLCEPRPRSVVTRAMTIVAILLMAGTALAGAVPAGGEFQINTFTAGNQLPGATQTSSVAADDAGNFIAVWSSADQDGSLEGIYAQRFSANGAPMGAEFRVNTTTFWRQTSPVVAMGPSGNFVVVWQDLLKDGDSYGIYLQRFDSAGNPVGVETRVNDTTTSFQVDASVAINSSGEFVVTWASNAQDGSLYGVYAKRYNANGTQKGPEFHVSTQTLDNQAIPNVALDDLGRFVITWSSRGQDGAGYGVYFQQFNTSGVPVGVETRANTFTASDQIYSTVGLDAFGNFAISWTSTGQDGDGDGIYARQYDWQGNPFGPEFVVNGTTVGRQYIGKLAMNDAGAFVVAWRSVGQDGSDEGIYARLFNANGTPNGNEFLVNTTTSNTQASESATYNGNRLVMIWGSNGQDGSGYGVYGQRYLVCDPLDPTPAITPSQNSVCANASATASVQAAYATYAWSITNGTIQGATNLPSVAFTAGSSGTTQLTVSVTNAAGCPATANASINVLTPVVPTISASGPTTFCEGGSVTLTASAGASYLWSNGATTPSINVNASGNYSVTVTSANGCSATSAPTSVTVNPLPAPTISASGPTTFCEGGSVTLTASAGTSYLWSNGATTASINVNASGSYSVTVTNANGCSATSTPVGVTVNPLPDATISASGPTTFCQGSSVTLSAPQLGGASYLWSNGATTPDLTVTASGTFSVSVTSAAGCARTSASVTVTVNPYPAAGIHHFQIFDDSGSGTVVRNGDTIEACGNPTVRLVPFALDPSYSYSWSNGATTAVLDVTTSGTYAVTVTPPNGCATTSSVVVHYGAFPAKPAIAATATELCPAGGTVTLTAPNADAWTWSTGATTQSIVVAEPGSYTVRIRNGACDSPLSDPLVITTGTSTIATTDSLALCGPSGSATLTANAGTSWLWSNGATTQSIVVTAPGTYSVTTTNAGCTMAESAPVTVTARSVTINANGPTTFCEGGSVTLTASAGMSWLWSNGATTQAITVSTSGNYSVTATFPDNCTIVATPVSVEARHITVSVAADRTTVCPNGAIALSASANGCSNCTYQWFDNTYTPIAGATSPTLTIHPSTSGFVYVKVHDDLGCEATSGGTIYTVLPTPDATISAASSLCEGQPGSASVADGGSGVTYSWTIVNGTLSFPNASAVTFTPNGLDPVTLTVTIANAGCSVTNSKIVTILPRPTATINASGPTTFCTGGSVTLTASAGSSYLWSNGATTQSINVTSGGSYSVTVTNANGCSATSSATNVTVNPLPTATINASGPTTFCTGGSVTLTASAGSSYLWSNGATTQSINVTSSGSYSVTVTNANGCSATSSATNVTVNPLPTATINASGPTTFCTGGSVTLTASAGSSYLWSNGATTQSINVISGGNYSVTITNANGCSATSSATSVTVNPLPTATINASGPTTFCTGGSVTLTASAGSSYLWSNGATTQSINVTNGGSYSVTVTNANGCSATSSPRLVTVNPKPSIPTITPSGPTTFCAGGSVTLTAPSGFSYVWSNGATTQSIVVSATGAYSVTVTNGSGCSTSSTVTNVTVNATTTITQQPQSRTIPKNTSATLSVTATGTGTLTYQWYSGTSPSTSTPISGATTSSYTTPRLPKGTYRYWVRVTGSCGVVNSATATITAQ